MGEQQRFYSENEEYADFLEGWDVGFYAKYADTLCPDEPGSKALDVGCGVGQVVQRLMDAGCEAHGVEVSEPSIKKARRVSDRCQAYDGRTLPYDDASFDSVGALNVLEHVEEPEAFLAELVRVVKPGGKVAVSSPNFFRALGLRDYHPRMRGLSNKWRNWQRLRAKRRQMASDPGSVRFDRMEPIRREPFRPDDDAIVATNGVEIKFFLERNGCDVLRVECTDRYVAKPIDFALNLGPWRHLMFNAFVVARRK
jgi:SAM-dependent methyltransferase